MPAKWTTEGNAAGPLRNGRMAEIFGVDGAVAFKGAAALPICASRLVLTESRSGNPTLRGLTCDQAARWSNLIRAVFVAAIASDQ